MAHAARMIIVLITKPANAAIPQVFATSLSDDFFASQRIKPINGIKNDKIPKSTFFAPLLIIIP